MAIVKTFWKTAADGDATDPANWTLGIGAEFAAIVKLPGIYALMDNGDFIARSLTFKAVDASFTESATAAMQLRFLTLNDGTVNLAGDNHIGHFNLNGGVLNVQSAQALGGADFNIDNGTIWRQSGVVHLKGSLN
jgi:hypothetical protein